MMQNAVREHSFAIVGQHRERCPAGTSFGPPEATAW